ncbi:NAD-dependent epimerase/dehydratase family protein [Nonomuraea ferruginea]
MAYSRVKLATERALLAARSGKTELVVLRPPFIWGRGMKTINEMVEVAEAGRFAWIDDGKHIADFVHVENLASAAILALTRGRHKGVYYVTDGTPMPIRDFLTPLLATRGVDLSKSRSVPPGDGGAHGGDDGPHGTSASPEDGAAADELARQLHRP